MGRGRDFGRFFSATYVCSEGEGLVSMFVETEVKGPNRHA